MAQVRFFAAAAEAAGASSETVDAATLGDLRAALVAERSPAFERVLERCSILVDGLNTTDPDTPVDSTTTVDVLPPFAGG